jgi:TRAP-type C4-dicarboxylate transport system permease small subunit
MTLRNYIKSGTKESSMRLAFIIVAFLCALLVFTVIYVMIRQAENMQFPGYEIAAIITATAALFSGSAYMKKEQRRHENHFNNSDHNDGPAVG